MKGFQLKKKKERKEKKKRVALLKMYVRSFLCDPRAYYVHFMGFSPTGFLSKQERIPYFPEK